MPTTTSDSKDSLSAQLPDDTLMELAQGHDAHPGVRAPHHGGLPAGQNRRVLPHLHRARRPSPSVRFAACATTTRSSPPTATTATRSPAACTPTTLHGRDVRQARGLRQGQGRLHAHVRPPNATSTAVTASSGRCPSARRAGLRIKYDAEDNDGEEARSLLPGRRALNQGAFHESLNLAGHLDLPVISSSRTTGYSMGTPSTAARPWPTTSAKKAEAYGIALPRNRRATCWTSTTSFQARATQLTRRPTQRPRLRQPLRPTATRATPCPTPRSTAPRKRSMIQGRGSIGWC